MMDKLFQHPGWLKVFSVIGAILIWAYVMPGYTKETARTFSDISLAVLPHPSFEPIDGPNLRTTVQVRAEGKTLAVNRLKKEELMAEVDLSRVTEPGKPTQVEVVVKGPERVTYSVSPKTITVTLIEQKAVAFPVTLVAPGSKIVTYNGMDYRYKARLEKDKVSISGRSDFLDRVKEVRLVLDDAELKPANESIVKTVIPVDAAGREVEKLTRPQLVVHLEWGQLPPGKLFKIQPDTKGALPAGRVVSRIEVEPAVITVRATNLKGTLPPVEMIETDKIDLTGRDKTFSTTVRLIPPPGTVAAVETVNVKVFIEEIVVDRIFRGVPLTKSGEATNALVSLSYSEVQISLKGPYSVMANLDAASIKAYVDVEGVQEGKQPLPVKVAVPPGVTEVAVDPAIVEVTITRQ